MEKDQATQGAVFALGAYTLWGIAPMYFKQLTQVPAYEILTHRVIWSFLLLLALLSMLKLWPRVRAILRQPRYLALLTLSSCIIGLNWLVFIWAVNNNHMLDASLGYYINPLFNIVLAMLFLGERFRPVQWVAVALAASGVVIQLVVFGSLPWVALVLAISFGFYGLIRKKVPVDPVTGLMLETLVLLPLAAIYLFGFAESASSQMSTNTLNTNLWLISAGIVTTAPLLLFAGAAKRLRLSTLGFFQYIGPSLMFLLAVVIYDEPFTQDKVITFALIWLSLVIYSWDGIKQRRRTAISRQSVS
ncbi:chloramphenicol resistance permease RarD [Oceanisphaera marina]|uniref:Chloramphenicol resistance permease RarD n=1 Tax=Oceanisphaera marina TaxID=2017550 RepID=A0ABQ1IME1_9GAMM|nr:EamA family transporter RarD [Oceanisphaera marina]GGB43369.1 chloramphenicol resistance permease RarD [Oceanisphaera marina]